MLFMIFILHVGGYIVYSELHCSCSNTLGGSRFSVLPLAFSSIDRCPMSSHFAVHSDGPIAYGFMA
jgi:hypothetical protein